MAKSLRACAAATAALLMWTAGAGRAQAPAAGAAETDRVGARIRALERESEALAAQARTILGDLRALEVERDLRRAQAARAEAATAASLAALRQVSERIVALDQERLAQLPSLRTQLVDLYKRGRGRYAGALLSVADSRTLARNARLLAALSFINESRLADHERVMAAIKSERTALESEVARLGALETEAGQARAAAERAIAARAARIAEIDSRRDLTAQYLDELQSAQARLTEQLVRPGKDGTRAVAVPLAPFKGALDWPVSGKVSSRFGVPDGRLGGSATRNGIEIAAADGTAVRAVHGGLVAFAGVFPGFGTLVIVEHGGADYTLYGYLGTVDVGAGETVQSGSAIGRVGPAPAGPPALYFELRVDGRATDPLQWLMTR